MEDHVAEFPLTLRADDEFGDWLYATLVAEYAQESEGWAVERVERVTGRLNDVRLACPVAGTCPHPLKSHILWVGATNAFAAPGRYIYITRPLLERFGDDDPVAFILAHEMAHHDMGHVRLLTPALAKVRYLPGSLLVAAVLKVLQGAFRTRAQEEAADAYALDLCIAAGYDPKVCLTAFDIMEAHLLDVRAIDAVFGPNSVCHRHPPVTARRASLQRQLAREYGYR